MFQSITITIGEHQFRIFAINLKFYKYVHRLNIFTVYAKVSGGIAI